MQVELKLLQSQLGITFIFVTHDQEEALAMSDSIAVMRHGRIEQLGAPTELYDAPATAFVAGFIGTQNYLPGYRVDDSLMMRAELDVMFEAGRAARGLARDAHVLGAVRPENVQLAGDEPSSRNRLKARIAATVMLHPGPIDIAAGRSLALSEATVRYTGRESHAAVAPYLGINAADAVTVTQVAIGLLRQQLAPGQMMHGIVTDGGQAANIIPARAELRYTMRAANSESLRELESRMAGCFAAGAVATGCEHVVTETAPPYAELLPDAWLSSTLRAEMVRFGRTPVPEDVEASMPLGSTDMGNVTQVMPGIHPIVGIDAGGASIHQPGFAAAAVSASADTAVVEGSIMLARTVVALAETAPQRDRVLEQQQRRAS